MVNNSAVETRSREMFTSDNNYIRHYGTSVIYDAHYILCIVGITLICCAVHKEPRRAERMTTGFDKHITRKRSILPWPRATARSSAQIASLYRRLMPVYTGRMACTISIYIYIRCALNPDTRLRRMLPCRITATASGRTRN